jgi:geranylgeranyl pyrophosphate synthase
LRYRWLIEGKKYQRSNEQDEFVTPSQAQDKAMKYAKKLIVKALAEMESGHKENAAKPLLELVLMVVTPISG